LQQDTISNKIISRKKEAMNSFLSGRYMGVYRRHLASLSSTESRCYEFMTAIVTNYLNTAFSSVRHSPAIN